MSNLDLRKFNIKTDEDAIEFLELIVAKAPQFIRLLKSNNLDRQSLRNKVAQAPNPFAVNDNASAAPQASVLERMSGKTPAPASTQNDRLEQLQAAKDANQVQPGDIGGLKKGDVADLQNVVSEPAPDAGFNEDGTPILPDQTPENVGEGRDLSGEAAVEQTTTGGAEQEDILKSPGVVSEAGSEDQTNEVKAKVPTEEDLTPIGSKVAGKADSFDDATKAKHANGNAKRGLFGKKK